MEDFKFLKTNNKENSGQNEKIRRISQNLQQMTVDAKNAPPQKSVDQLELRLRQLEEKYENFKEFDEKRFHILKETLDNSKRSFEREKKDEREMYDDFRNSFDFWQNETNQKLQNMVAGSNSFEIEIIDNIVQNLIKSTNEELIQEENKMEEMKENIFKNLNAELSKNKDKFAETSQDQDKFKAEIVEIFEKESKFIADKIVDYKISKKEVEETVFGLIKEFVEKTQEEIENEHKERVKQEDQILNLLDKATTKLNHLSQV